MRENETKDGATGDRYGAGGDTGAGIAGGTGPREGRRPTMADVAARVGVSRALVSVVFRNAEGASPRTRERVFQAAAELGYQPDNAARLLRRRRSGQLGVLYTTRHAFEAELVDALYPAAERRGYSLVLSATAPEREETKAIEDLLSFRSEALLLISPRTRPALLSSLVGAVPVVTIGRQFRGTDFDSVLARDAHGVRSAVDHLVGLGHRRISHIDGGTMAGAAERRRGYREAMRRNGLGAEAEIVPGDYSEDSGARAAREFLRRDTPPTAVLAGNDRCALGLLDALLRMGVNVPRDMSVVGYDDSQLARMTHIALTTVWQDTESQAEAAVRAALERLDGRRTEPRRVSLTPRLVVRGTTGPPPKRG